MMRRVLPHLGRRGIATLDDHPNLADIRRIADRVPHLTDRELRALAAQWSGTAALNGPRERSLAPDAPLVVDLLRAIDLVHWLAFPGGHEQVFALEPGIVRRAEAVIRDALSAAYARPVLSRRDYRALVAGWDAVFPLQAGPPSCYGTRADDVFALLDALMLLRYSCHDERARGLARSFAALAATIDPQLRCAATGEAQLAADITGRRWIGRYCLLLADPAVATECPDCGTMLPSPADVVARQLVAEAIAVAAVADTAWGCAARLLGSLRDVLARSPGFTPSH